MFCKYFRLNFNRVSKIVIGTSTLIKVHLRRLAKAVQIYRTSQINIHTYVPNSIS